MLDFAPDKTICPAYPESPMMTRVVKSLQRPFYWFLLQTTQDNTWQKYACRVPLHVYGAGSRRCFSWYLDGAVDSGTMEIEEMKNWLSRCQYMADSELFDQRDVWQHPITFERLRRGDCEDYSLWTWRKLIENGIEAEFCAGWSIQPGEEYRGHTWVMFKEDNQQFLFDPVARNQHCMVQPLEEVADWYVPQVSVNGRLNQFVYGGYYDSLRPGWQEASANKGIVGV